MKKEKKFNSRGVYVISIKGLKAGENLYLDKIYEYDIYYYSSKKEYSGVKGKLMEHHLESSYKDFLPTPKENIKYFNSDNNACVDNSNIFENLPVEKISYNKKNFYCVILDEIGIDDLIFSASTYNQKIYEFKTKEELDAFINGNKKDKKPKKIVNSTLKTKKEENIVYLVVNGNKQKVLEKEYILDSKKFNSYYTTVVLWPSMDTYVFNCHEDSIIEANTDAAGLLGKDERFKSFIDLVGYYHDEGKLISNKLECQYIGKTFDFDFDFDFSISSKFLISNYLIFDIIYEKETLDHLEYIRSMEKVLDLNEKIKTNPEGSVGEARDLLITMRIIDEMGNVLTPFNRIISKDDSLENNSDNISKTKKTRNKKDKK